MKWLEFALLAVGAVSGADLRYKIVESPITIAALPINGLIVNVLGSFILGLFSAISLMFNLDSKFTLLFAVGFCGSFTTMSSFELEASNLVDNHRIGIAALDIAANVGLSFVAVMGGRMLGAAILGSILN